MRKEPAGMGSMVGAAVAAEVRARAAQVSASRSAMAAREDWRRPMRAQYPGAYEYVMCYPYLGNVLL